MRTATRMAVALAAFAAVPAQAQSTKNGVLHDAIGASDDWTITASIRPRIEGIDGQFRSSAADDDVLFSIRSTLFVEYHPGPLRAGVEIWDVRGYGEKRASSTGTGEVNALEPIQAYVAADLGGSLGDGSRSSLLLGRFTEDLGARRLIARQRFRNTTNAFTGAKFDWQGNGGDSATLFWSMPQRRLPSDPGRIQDNAVVLDSESPDQQFFGAWYTKGHVFGGSLALYGFGLTERDGERFQTANRHLFTPGLRLSREPKPDAFDYDLEFDYQLGRTRATTAVTDRTDLDVSAYFLHASIARTFAGGWSPRAIVGYDRASGDGRGTRSFNRFDTLFGARRDLGPTDLYGALQRANLSSPYARVETVPKKGYALAFEYRAAFLVEPTDTFAATGIRDRTGRAGEFAGHQFETKVNVPLIANLAKLEAGFVYLLDGRFLHDAPNARDSGDTKYGYTDVTFSF